MSKFPWKDFIGASADSLFETAVYLAAFYGVISIIHHGFFWRHCYG